MASWKARLSSQQTVRGRGVLPSLSLTETLGHRRTELRSSDTGEEQISQPLLERFFQEWLVLGQVPEFCVKISDKCKGSAEAREGEKERGTHRGTVSFLKRTSVKAGCENILSLQDFLK